MPQLVQASTIGTYTGSNNLFKLGSMLNELSQGDISFTGNGAASTVELVDVNNLHKGAKSLSLIAVNATGTGINEMFWVGQELNSELNYTTEKTGIYTMSFALYNQQILASNGFQIKVTVECWRRITNAQSHTLYYTFEETFTNQDFTPQKFHHLYFSVPLNMGDNVDFRFKIESLQVEVNPSLYWNFSGFMLTVNDKKLDSLEYISEYRPPVGYIEEINIWHERKDAVDQNITLTANTDNILIFSGASTTHSTRELLDDQAKLVPVQHKDVYSHQVSLKVETPSGTGNHLEVRILDGDAQLIFSQTHHFSKAANDIDYINFIFNIPNVGGVFASGAVVSLKPNVNTTLLRRGILTTRISRGK